MLTSVWKESGRLFSDKEKAALRWAECLTLIASAPAPDEDYAALQPYFSEKEIVDINIAIGLMNAYNRMAISLKKRPASVTDQ